MTKAGAAASDDSCAAPVVAEVFGGGASCRPCCRMIARQKKGLETTFAMITLEWRARFFFLGGFDVSRVGLWWRERVLHDRQDRPPDSSVSVRSREISLLTFIRRLGLSGLFGRMFAFTGPTAVGTDFSTQFGNNPNPASDFIGYDEVARGALNPGLLSVFLCRHSVGA